MKTKIIVTLSLLLEIIVAQADINFSYEMKYGDGKQVTGTASNNPDTLDYNYFENLLDINTYYGDNIYFYTQLEYSNHPVYGNRRSGLDSLVNTFYLEYSDDRINIQLGDLYELFGRGMCCYTFQNQNIDYNNSIKGLSIKYFMRENIEISALIGKGDYYYRSKPSNRESDLQLNSSAVLASVDYSTDMWGDFQFLNTKQQLLIDPMLTGILANNKTEISLDLQERLAYNQPLFFIELLSAEEGEIIDTVNISSYNLNWNFNLGPFDIYIDKAWVNYEKIFGDDVFGSRFYSSVYTDFMGAGITYEHKNYYTPYLINTISNLPIVYRETNSVLSSRNSISVNFGNEIGHQIEINKIIFENMNLMGNISFAYRHKKEGMADLSVLDFLKMSEASGIYNYYPYRQIYLEVNGWALSDRLFYKLGVDHFSDFKFLSSGKNTDAFTVPSHWVWKFSNGSSLLSYLEIQSKTDKQINQPDYSVSYEKNYINQYVSLSYNHLGKWTLTGFFDREVVNDKASKWPGLDFSFYLNSESIVSLFYGSQKGGMVCANGVCAEQPGFSDGMKITYRSLF